MPLMGNFFDRLEEVACPNLHCFMREWFGNPRHANVEEVLLAIEQLQDAPVAARRCREAFGPDFVSNARTELSQYILRRLSHEAIDPRHWGVQFVSLVDADTTVVTTNYDRVAELLLSNRRGIRHLNDARGEPTCPHCRLRALLTWHCQCSGEVPVPEVHWRGAILKLHGSITWHTCRNEVCDQEYCLIPDPGCRPFQPMACACCQGRTEPVLVLPSMTKTYGAYPQLERMWEATLAALEDAVRLVIFGFSFPTSDAAICRLFRKSIDAGSRLRELIVIDAAPGPVADRIRALLPDGRNIDLQTYVVPTDGSTPSWWKGPHATARKQSCDAATPNGAGSRPVVLTA
jgi:NAD-dependent SIR2 family protein deacetylase